MPYSLEITLLRHGETTWSLTGRHTSFTDLDLTENGISQAKVLKKWLKGRHFDHVFVSPLKRAVQTAKLANLLAITQVLPELTEWNYGDLEGLTTAEIRSKIPNWILFRDGAPRGETPSQIQIRAESIINRLQSLTGSIALVSSGHFLRALTAKWLNFPVEHGQHFLLSTGSISILGYEREIRVIKLWNQTQTR